MYMWLIPLKNASGICCKIYEKRVFSWKNHGRKHALSCDSGCAASLGANITLGEPTRALWAEFLWALGTDHDPTGDSGFPGLVQKSLEIYSCLYINCPSQRHPEGIRSKLLAILPHHVLHRRVQRGIELYFIILYLIKTFLLLVLRCFIYLIQDEGTARSGLETFALHQYPVTSVGSAGEAFGNCKQLLVINAKAVKMKIGSHCIGSECQCCLHS